MNSWNWDDLQRMVEAFPIPDVAGGKQRRIVDAATELFIRQGYRKTSVEEVARRAQVAKGTIYLYFATKSDLLIATVADEKRKYLSRLKPIFDPDLEPVERLRRYLRLMMTMAREMPLTSRLLSGDREIMIVLEEMDPALRDQMLELQIGFIAGFLEGAAADWLSRSELRDRARVLLGLMTSSGFFVDDQGRNGMPLEDFAAILTEWLVSGLVAPSRSEQTVSEAIRR